MNTTTIRALVACCLGLLQGACLSAEAERRGLLAECTFNDECEQPLLCAARKCRAPCRTDRDCTNQWLCRSAGQEDKLVCYARQEVNFGCVRNGDCTSPLVCGPNRECILQCRTDYDCRVAYPYETSARCVLADNTCDAHPRYVRDGGADVLQADQ